MERRRARIELVAIVATALAYLYFENVLELKLHFLVPCAALWAGYVGWRLWKEPGSAERWGFSRPRSGWALCAACFVLGAGLLGVYRVARGWLPFPPGAWVIFAIYPVWAFIQQFVAQGLVAANLERLGAPRGAVIPLAAVAFGLAHLPDWRLGVLCAGAGLVWTPIFLRHRNLWPLALTHAWLGALAYYWILERDPWREMFPG